jgi:hypothetical protein
MPLPFALVLGPALGVALAWVAAPELGSNENAVLTSRPLAVVTAFTAFVWLPVVGYFVAFHGDWSLLYLLPWARVPSAVDLTLVLLTGASVVGGFCAGAEAVRRRRLGRLVAVIAGCGGFAAAGLPFVARRLAVSATYAQFHGDFGTEPIGASLLGKGVLVMGTVLVAGIAWTARSLTRMGRSS